MRKIKDGDEVRSGDMDFLEKHVDFDTNDLMTWGQCNYYRKLQDGDSVYGAVYRVPPSHRFYEVGDIMPAGECKVGWRFQYVEAYIEMHDGIDSELKGERRTVSRIEGKLVYFPGGGRCYLNSIVKLISKHEEEPAEEPEEAPEPEEAICAGGPSRETQPFKVPGDFLVEMLSKIEGMPLDIVCDSDESLLYCSSVEFTSDMEPIKIIRTRDGWKVEGT